MIELTVEQYKQINLSISNLMDDLYDDSMDYDLYRALFFQHLYLLSSYMYSPCKYKKA